MKDRIKSLIDGKPFNIFLGLLTIAIWGYAYIVIRVTVKGNPPTIPPVSLAFIRFVIGYVVLLFIPVRGEKKLAPRDSRTVICMGLLGMTLYFYFENTGLIYTTATNASILISLVPMLTVIGAAVFFKQKYSWLNILGLPIAFAGGALVIWNGTVNFHLKPLGDFLILISAVSWVGYTLVGKNITARYSAILLTRRVTLVGIVTLFPVFIFELATGQLKHITWISLAGAAYLGVFCHAAAMSLWIRCWDKLGIVFVSNLIYLQCVATMLFAWLTIKEPITWFLIVCAGTVVLGVYLSNLRLGVNVQNAEPLR
jgi:drug/metabolite transporter (DMT)-like permease